MNLNSARLIEFYRQMLRIRRIEEKIAELYPEQEMRCPVHLCIGEEAPAVGVCAALETKDYVLSAHRSHGHYLAKGGDLNAMMAELCGKATGSSSGMGGSMHLMDLEAGFLASTPIVGSTIPIAVGAAWGSVMKKDPRVTVVFLGEAATEEGVFHEAVEFSLLKNLPVIFACTNNLYSVYSPLGVRQPATREVFELAKGHGMEAHLGDGNDVEEVYALASAAVKKARDGKGPTFLEMKSYRWREHCGPNYDNTIGYRTEDEFLEWKKKCPIERFEKKLLQEKVMTPADFQKIAEDIDAEIAESVRFSKESPFPEKNKLFENIYAS